MRNLCVLLGGYGIGFLCWYVVTEIRHRRALRRMKDKWRMRARDLLLDEENQK